MAGVLKRSDDSLFLWTLTWTLVASLAARTIFAAAWSHTTGALVASTLATTWAELAHHLEPQCSRGSKSDYCERTFWGTEHQTTSWHYVRAVHSHKHGQCCKSRKEGENTGNNLTADTLTTRTARHRRRGGRNFAHIVLVNLHEKRKIFDIFK